MARKKAAESTELEPVRAYGPSLVALEQEYDALLNTAEMVPAEQLEAFNLELQKALAVSVDKRDRTGQFDRYCDSTINAMKEEKDRLDRRIAFFENAKKRLRNIVQFAIVSLGKGDDNKYKRLEGRLFTWRLQGKADKVQILDEAAIPDQYKTVTVTLPLADWKALTDANPWVIEEGLITRTVRIEISLKKIGTDLAADIEVPGAQLLDEQYSVQLG